MDGRMKKIVNIVCLLMVVLGAFSQTSPVDELTCEQLRDTLGLPHYYCDCEENSNTFEFPLEREVNDTVWYTASWDDLRQGISAYWFSSCSIILEAYATCLSKSPTFTLTVGGNQMRDMDVAKINEKLNGMSEREKELALTMKPHIRVYPTRPSNSSSTTECTGNVYCYPFDEGPQSTCGDPLPLRHGMTYVCDDDENDYRLDKAQIATTGKCFIRWMQKDGLPCEVWLTLDSCTGDTIGTSTLSDSLHVFCPDSTILKQARTQNRPVWLHVRHAAGIVGRIYYYRNPKYTEEALPTTNKNVCLGKTLSANMRTYTSDTSFVDTLWVKKDTLTTMNVTFTFKQPIVRNDTIYKTRAELKSFRYTDAKTKMSIILKLTDFCDTLVTLTKANTCTARVQLAVREKVNVPTDLDYFESEVPRAYKQIQNGQLFIIIDDRKYTLTGQQIK